MNYPFICERCGKQKEISMPMKDYISEGHVCECGGKMVRTVESLVCGLTVDKTGTFFKPVS